MTCDLHQINLSAILDGESSGPEAADTIMHTASCEDCRRFLEKLTRLSSSLQSWQIETAALSPPNPQPKRVFGKLVQWSLPLAAAAILALGILHWSKEKEPVPLQTRQLSQHHQIFLMGDALAGMEPRLNPLPSQP